MDPDPIQNTAASYTGPINLERAAAAIDRVILMTLMTFDMSKKETHCCISWLMEASAILFRLGLILYLGCYIGDVMISWIIKSAFHYLHFTVKLARLKMVIVEW